jgi:hypothetical protein
MAIGLELAKYFLYQIPQRGRTESKHCNISLWLRANVQLIRAKLTAVDRFRSACQQQ